MYLLDTDICIFLLKDKYEISQKIRLAGISNCYISEITIAELLYGAYFSDKFDKHIQEVAKIEALFEVIPIFDCLPLFGKEKARLRQLGQLIPDFDLLIATSAIQHNLTLVSNNTTHVSRVESINLENWVS